MTEIFEAKKKLLAELGWSENPFIKDLRVGNRLEFMKYYCPFEAESILKKLAFDAKACMLLGPKGVGKTSALYYVAYSLPQAQFDCIMFKEPPRDLEGLSREAGLEEKGAIGALKTLVFGKKQPISRQELAAKLRARPKKTVFFLDEAHLAPNPDIYMEFKYLLDEVPNLRLVISALGRENFPDSLLQLIGDGNVFTRSNFSAEEMRRIVEHRIKAVGGVGSRPFSDAVLAGVFSDQNLLTPRYVFDELNNYLAALATGGSKAVQKQAKQAAASERKAAGAKGKEAEEEGFAQAVAEEEVAEEAGGPYAHDSLIRGVIEREKAYGAPGSGEFTHMHADWWPLLSPSQQKVVTFLLKNDGATLSELLKNTGLSQNTAFNALYQLRGEDEAELMRKPEVPFPLVIVKHKLVGGRKKNIYSANPKVRNLFTLH
ncbi:MAG: ATP-binding protein [Candidatus Micrarchaeia archaeon]|jgi:hypothetical protein